MSPFARSRSTATLEGNELQVIHLGQGDVHDSTVVWIPSLRGCVPQTAARASEDSTKRARRLTQT
jgi:hypothetical protein